MSSTDYNKHPLSRFGFSADETRSLQHLLHRLDRPAAARISAAAQGLAKALGLPTRPPKAGGGAFGLGDLLGLEFMQSSLRPADLQPAFTGLVQAVVASGQADTLVGPHLRFVGQLRQAVRRSLNDEPEAVWKTEAAALKAAFVLFGLAGHAQRQGRQAQLTDLQPFAAAFDLLPCGALLVDDGLQILHANPAFGHLLGLTRDQVHGICCHEVLQAAALPHLIRRATQVGMAREQVTVKPPRADTPVPIRLTVHRLAKTAAEAAPGSPSHFLIVLEDLQALTGWGQELLHAQEVANVGSWHVDFSGGPVLLTPQAEAVLGWRPGGPITCEGYMGCVHPGDRGLVSKAWQAALDSGLFQIEHRVGTDADTRWIEVQGRIEYDDHRRPLRAFGTCMEISQRKLAQQDIERLARYDALTGLPNRAYGITLLQAILDKAKHQASPLALFLLDLDRFKETNESLGHAVGDQFIAAFGARLRESWHHSNAIVRMEGDQFLLACLVADVGQAQTLATDLGRALVHPLEVGVLRHTVSASAGIALSPQHGDSIAELLRNAEMAMYDAKKQGGGMAKVYDPESGERQHQRLRLGMRLEEAIRADQLELVYQAKIDLTSHRLSGAEALLRWHEQDLGWISPAEFIPLAEERGLILLLGDLVLEKACRQLRIWQQEGRSFDTRLAINVSPVQMADPEFARRAITITEKAGGLPHQFEFEITESAMMIEPELALFNAHVLCQAGFILSIDDFGTGYSSLARLHTFPVRKLKIDISFIRNMLSNPGHRTIVAAVIGMASALGLETVAEGVENQAQALLLRQLTCNTAQGYLFSRPMAALDFAHTWLTPT